MKRSTILSVAATIAVLAIAVGGSISEENPKIKVQDKVPSKAYPFDLSAVRLLDGLFREAMLRDQRYLLELDFGPPAPQLPRNGWFSYRLKVLPDRPMSLVCTYVGSEGRTNAALREVACFAAAASSRLFYFLTENR